MKPFLLMILLGGALPLAAQLHPDGGASRYTRLAAPSPAFADASSFVVNPAALARMPRFSAALYGERRFLLDGVQAFQGSVAFPAAGGCVGGLLTYGGGGPFSQTGIGAAYGRSLGPMLDVGVQFRYESVRMAGYGGAGGLTADAGLRLHLGERLHAGAYVHNPARVRLGKEGEERLPAAFGLALCWERAGQWLMAAELRQQGSAPPALTAGLQFRIAGALSGRAGISTDGPVAFLGAGVRVQNFTLEATASAHRLLGFTPGLLLLYPAQ